MLHLVLTLIALSAVGFGALLVGFTTARHELRRAAKLGLPIVDRGRIYFVESPEPPPPPRRDKRLLRVLRREVEP